MKDATAAIAVRLAATDWKNMIDDVYNAKILGFAGNIARIGRGIPADGARVFEVPKGCVICPGLVDMHVHLSRPIHSRQ